jgi:hypothetical protein
VEAWKRETPVAMLRSAGGCITAARHCVSEWYDRPNMPTVPFEPGSPAAHATVS